MPTVDLKMNRKKVALNEQTYDKLKAFSRFNGLKLRIVIDAMTEVMLNDEALSARIIDKTLELQPEDDA